MLKNSKFIAGVCFLAQSFTCFIMGLIYLKKKKSLSGTFFALGAVGGIAGAWMLYDECKKISDSKLFDLDECDDDEFCLDDELFEEETNEDDINFSFVEDSAEEAAAE